MKKAMSKPRIWGHAQQGGWKFTESVQRIEHKCCDCGRVKYLYQYPCLKFWRMTLDGPQVLTKLVKGEAGVKLRIDDPCYCVGINGRLTGRLLRLMAKQRR